jgi:hypothetical protein
MLAVVEEMLALQYTMVWVAYRIRARYGEASNSFLDEMIPIVETYGGPDRDETGITMMKSLRARAESERVAAERAMKKPDAGIRLIQYQMPLLATQIAELRICEVEFQRAILFIRHQLDIFNQLAPYAMSLFDKTYGNLEPKDREKIIANQEGAYRAAARHAEIVFRAIGRLKEEYGKP